MSASDLTEERDALRETARRLLDNESSPERVRAVMEEPVGHDANLWRTMAGLGWHGLAVAEEYGGAGYSFAELAVVLEELGRHLTPSPFFSTAVLGASALLAGADERTKSDLLPRLCAGELIVALATAPIPRGGGPTVQRTPSGYLLDGMAAFVADAHVAHLLVVAANHREDPDSATLFLLDRHAEGVSVRVLPTLDRTRRLCEVRFERVTLEPEAVLGEPSHAAPLVDWIVDKAAVALAADCVGGAERVMEMCADYASHRVQFGRPIGTFQAIKHRCADMLILVEASRAAAEEAARTSPSKPGPSTSAAVAKSYAGDAYARIASDGIQLHGGVGFTWEHDIHLYFKRAKLNQVWFGDPSWHRSRLANLLLPRGAIRSSPP